MVDKLLELNELLEARDVLGVAILPCVLDLLSEEVAVCCRVSTSGQRGLERFRSCRHRALLVQLQGR